MVHPLPPDVPLDVLDAPLVDVVVAFDEDDDVDAPVSAVDDVDPDPPVAGVTVESHPGANATVPNATTNPGTSFLFIAHLASS